MRPSISDLEFPPARLSWSVWALGALFYLIGFFQRVAPGVMTNELTEDFSLNAAALGNLSAFYFYSYVAMQVPTGVLADRWGPRKLLVFGALVAAVGSLLFALSPNLAVASSGRLLVGASVAVAFVAVLKLAAHWIPHKRYALASGLALCVGVSGAVFAGVPLRLMIDQFGWRPVMFWAAIVTLVIALLIWIFVRNDPTEKGYKSYFSGESTSSCDAHQGLVSSVASAFSVRNIRLLFFVPGGVVGAILAFAGLWGVPFLTTHYGMVQTQAAGYCSLMLIAWAVGGPIIGWFSDYSGKRKPIYVVSCLALIALWGILLSDVWSTMILFVLVTLIGLFSGAMVLSFAYARESAASKLTGTVSGLINMGVMLGPMMMQPAVGFVLDLVWEGEQSGATRIYSLQSYQYAFGLFFVWLLVSTVFIFLSKETHCKPFKQ